MWELNDWRFTSIEASRQVSIDNLAHTAIRDFRYNVRKRRVAGCIMLSSRMWYVSENEWDSIKLIGVSIWEMYFAIYEQSI